MTEWSVHPLSCVHVKVISVCCMCGALEAVLHASWVRLGVCRDFGDSTGMFQETAEAIRQCRHYDRYQKGVWARKVHNSYH